MQAEYQPSTTTKPHNHRTSPQHHHKTSLTQISDITLHRQRLLSPAPPMFLDGLEDCADPASSETVLFVFGAAAATRLALWFSTVVRSLEACVVRIRATGALILHCRFFV